MKDACRALDRFMGWCWWQIKRPLAPLVPFILATLWAADVAWCIERIAR